MTTKDYVSTKEQAAWIRTALRASFPGCKFSVRAASGGAVTIRWTDGPTTARVKEITRQFELEGFDGMTDMRYNIPLSMNGREVYGGGLILESRDISDEWRDEILREFEQITGHAIPDPDVRDSGYWETRIPLNIDRLTGEVHHMVDSEVEYVSELLYRCASWRTR